MEIVVLDEAKCYDKTFIQKQPQKKKTVQKNKMSKPDKKCTAEVQHLKSWCRMSTK